ncbi:hypothetical protein [Flavitalea sp.]|nr:hypothetical protein [Flavitalea sp.]
MLIFISLFVQAGYLIGSLPFLQPWLKYIITFFVLAVTVSLVAKIIKTIRKPTGMKADE